MTLSIDWEGIAVSISHKPNWLHTGYDHIEIRAGEGFPISETGYRSHFMHPDELAQFEDVLDFVRQWLDDAAQSKEWQTYVVESRQLSLF